MATAKRKTETNRREVLARLQTPAHVTASRFEERKRVEGYFEDRSVPDFIGCNRLLKWDTVYGTIQLGYNPKRGQPFLFANIKTSIYDNAASRDQRKMTEAQRMLQQKGNNRNRAYSARRRPNSSVLLYNSENRPWSASSLRPYLIRADMEALGKTMPFLLPEGERATRRAGARKDRELSAREGSLGGAEQAGVRAERRLLAAEQEELGAIIRRKEAGTRNFFRRINLVYDLQKQAIFAHYRNRTGRTAQRPDNLTAQPEEDETK